MVKLTAYMGRGLSAHPPLVGGMCGETEKEKNEKSLLRNKPSEQGKSLYFTALAPRR